VTKEGLAALLNGREYGDEMTAEEERDAGQAGLLVVFGASDDLAEFRGAWIDEAGCSGGGTLLFDREGLIPSNRSDRWSDEEMARYFARKAKALQVEALWCAEPGYSWTYKTDLPHATFEVVEDGEPYCRGIVINLAEVTP